MSDFTEPVIRRSTAIEAMEVEMDQENEMESQREREEDRLRELWRMQGTAETLVSMKEGTAKCFMTEAGTMNESDAKESNVEVDGEAKREVREERQSRQGLSSS